MKDKYKLYHLGEMVGLRKEEIDEIIQTVPNTQLPDPVMPSLQNPIDVYSPAADYGTVSIRDFR